MPLESKIDLLTQAVERLTEALEGQRSERQGTATDGPVVTDVAETDEDNTPAPQPTQPETDAKADTDSVTLDDLQDLCMALVRDDRAKKPKVKETIAQFGQAKTLKDVPESDYAALKAALGALQ